MPGKLSRFLLGYVKGVLMEEHPVPQILFGQEQQYPNETVNHSTSMAVGKPGLQLLLVCAHLGRHTGEAPGSLQVPMGIPTAFPTQPFLGLAGVLTRG